MYIFDEDYPYKLKLLGYSLQQKKDEYVKANIYIKSHGLIYTISYILTVSNNQFLTCEQGYDEIELFQAQFFGVCDENITPIRVNVNHIDLTEKNIPNAYILIKLLEENAEIIATNYFAIEFKTKSLILYPEKFEQAPSTVLLRKLIRE